MFFLIDNIDIADDNTHYSVRKSQCDLETETAKGIGQTF